MILENEKIKQALEYIKEEDPATTQDTLNMCQIPAPSYKEEKKAEYIRERFWEISSRKANFRLSGLQLIVRKQLFVTMSPLPMHQACAIGKNRSVIK